MQEKADRPVDCFYFTAVQCCRHKIEALQNSIVKLRDIHFILLFLSEQSFVRISDLINKLTKMKETSTDSKDAVCSHSPTES